MVLLISGMTISRDTERALAVFRKNGGVLRTGVALAQGIHSESLYRLVEDGTLIRLARGLYRLASASEFSDPDLAVVAAKAPSAVVCLISALAFHGVTTQVPHVVHIAVPRGKYAGLRLRTPPVKVYRYDAATFDRGVETHAVDGTPLRVYSVSRTLVDCFKYRNKIGLDIAVEALRLARKRNRIRNRDILPIARMLRQEQVMGPYLEAVV